MPWRQAHFLTKQCHLACDILFSFFFFWCRQNLFNSSRHRPCTEGQVSRRPWEARSPAPQGHSDLQTREASACAVANGRMPWEHRWHEPDAWHHRTSRRNHAHTFSHVESIGCCHQSPDTHDAGEHTQGGDEARNEEHMPQYGDGDEAQGDGDEAQDARNWPQCGGGDDGHHP